MISNALSISLFLIFTILGGVHFYWLFGGIWGVKKVIPTKNKNTSPHTIPKLATLIVAVLLTSFGLIYLIKSRAIFFHLPQWITNYVYWFIPTIFILRAIGEFNYVGFFKRKTHTEFAKADTQIFSPLCLVVGVIGLLIQIMQKQ